MPNELETELAQATSGLGETQGAPGASTGTATGTTSSTSQVAPLSGTGTVTAPATGAVAGTTPPPAGTQTPAATPTFDLRGYLTQQGLNVGGFQDDRQAVEHLMGELRTAAQRIQQHNQMIQQYQYHLQQQAAAQQGQGQQQQKGWWAAPEFDPSWMNLVTKDEHGNPVLVPGAPPDTLSKIYAWKQHHAATMDKLARNPFDVIKPGLDEYLPKLIDQRVQELIGQQQRQQLTGQLSNRVAEWALRRDQNGAPVQNFLGQPILTPAGQLYAQATTALERAGVQDLSIQDHFGQMYALGVLAQKQMLAQQQQQGQPGAGISQIPGAAGSTLTPSNASVQQPAQNDNLTLRQMLERDLANVSVPNNF